MLEPNFNKLNEAPAGVPPQWHHPYLEAATNQTRSRQELYSFAYDYYLRFLSIFKNQREGSLAGNIEIELSKRLRNRLGCADLFRRRITLNQKYFEKDARLLPYSLFHEMVHLWLYDCYLDPGHTRRFYQKMDQFRVTRLPLDPDVHIHSRLKSDAKYIYLCMTCKNRWFTNSLKEGNLACGFCFENTGATHFPQLFRNPTNPSAKGVEGTRTPYFSSNLIGVSA